MTWIFDYTLKFILLFFVVVRLVSGPSVQPPAAEPRAEPAHEPWPDSLT